MGVDDRLEHDPLGVPSGGDGGLEAAAVRVARLDDAVDVGLLCISDQFLRRLHDWRDLGRVTQGALHDQMKVMAKAALPSTPSVPRPKPDPVVSRVVGDIYDVVTLSLPAACSIQVGAHRGVQVGARVALHQRLGVNHA